MSRKPPAFQFYADDFLAGCIAMEPEQVCAYIRLLCFQWSKGLVPSEPTKLERVTGVGMEHVQVVLDEHFQQVPGGWQNARLEDVRNVQRARAEAGRQGGQQANGKQTASKTEANPQANGKQNGSKPQANGQAKSNPPSPTPTPSMVDVDIDQIRIEEALRVEKTIFARLPPRTASDRLLAWRCAVLVTLDWYSLNWLEDSLAGVDVMKPKKPWAYFTTCLKKHRDAQRRDFEADCDRLPPRPRVPKRPPPDRPRAVLKSA